MNIEQRRLYMQEYRQAHRDKWRRTPDQQAKVNVRNKELYSQRTEEQKEKLRLNAKDWRARNPSVTKAQRLKGKYKLTMEEFQALLAKQSEVCAICKTDNWGGRSNNPHVDHDHLSGEVRGLLCTNCNVGLGRFKDSSTFLRSAADYLGD